MKSFTFFVFNSFLLVLMLSNKCFAQNTGIGTTTPAAKFEIAAVNPAAPTNQDGILIPRINAFPATAPTATQNGMMVFLTTVVGTDLPGFYYWDNTTSTWKGVSANTAWELKGNAGSNVLTNFIGTTDNVDMIFKRNNSRAGLLGINNTSFGASALNPLSTGFTNTAFGSASLFANTEGVRNTATGYGALSRNTTGSKNTANGSFALFFNTTGSMNTAYGERALSTNSTGSMNTGIGDSALYLNSTESMNTALGYNALYNSIGSNNIGIGFNAQVPIAAGNNQVRIGDAIIGYAGIEVAWTITSDKRRKSNITKTELGLEFIKNLNPVSYYRNNDKKQKTEFGFIAQEVEETLNKAGAANNGIITKDDAGMYSVRYNDFIAPIVKAIQELNDKIDTLIQQNGLQQNAITDLLKRLDAIEKEKKQ